MYKILKEFDINWWEKGDRRVISEYSRFLLACLAVLFILSFFPWLKLER
ncbi:MAG: hypothetical protein JXB88_26560 [Spirochaetales bacterium]|nr:hypothetical protein [Spirochaetales bacterium]